MPTTIRQLSPDQISRLTPQTFTLAPIFQNLAHYAGISGSLFLAETDNTPSACAAITYRKSSADQSILHIDHIVVSPQFRGHGLGGRLMKVVIGHAKSLSIPTITAEAPAWCSDWRAFYSRLGFVFTDPQSANSSTGNTPVELSLDA